jgi:hypothetical protein
MQEIADFFGVPSAKVSRAVRRLEARSGAGAKVFDCKSHILRSACAIGLKYLT